MNDHIPDATKMMQDTPRTDEAQFGTGRVSVDFARTLERELNAANERIKRMEEAGDAMVNEGWNEPHLAYAWRKAKESKP
jgi:predicted phage gp36 major capsid-like protein